MNGIELPEQQLSEVASDAPHISVAQLYELFDQLDHGMLAVKQDYRIAVANAAALRILGQPTGVNLEGTQLSGLSMLNDLQSKLEAADKKETMHHELRIKGLIETVIESKIAWLPKANLWTITLQDVSEEHHAESIRSELLELLKHDIKSPLTILSNPEQLSELTNADGLKREPHEMIRSCTARLQHCMDGILRVAGSRAVHIPRSWAEVNLSTMLDAQIKHLQLSMPYKTLRWNWSPSEQDIPLISADSRLLERALYELLKNAMEFSPRNDQIDVTLHSTPSGFIEISIEDHGPEIPESMYPKVFEEFTREEKQLGPRESQIGLGWVFVHHVAIFHGGSVRITHPLKGKGHRIVVSLPISGENKQADSKELRHEGELSNTQGKPLVARITPNQTNEQWPAQSLLKTQDQLTRSAKLSALGQMAGAIAHDMGNIISPIIGYADLLLMTPTLPENAKRYGDRIKRASSRACQTLRGLMSFIADRGIAHTPQNLGALMQNVLSFLEYNLNRKGIIPVLEIEPELPMVLGNAGQLETAFVSLLMYSRQAMQPKGGELNISLKKAVIGIQITFMEQSAGIAPDMLSRMFEPSFDANNLDKGLGLELFICHQIVEQHGGTIDVESVLGRSTTFHVLLPSIESKKEVLE